MRETGDVPAMFKVHESAIIPIQLAFPWKGKVRCLAGACSMSKRGRGWREKKKVRMRHGRQWKPSDRKGWKKVRMHRDIHEHKKHSKTLPFNADLKLSYNTRHWEWDRGTNENHSAEGKLECIEVWKNIKQCKNLQLLCKFSMILKRRTET